MTNIQITPKWPQVKPSLHYVYIHLEVSTGNPFYVGLGQNKRGWAAGVKARGLWWSRVANKHGVSIDIVQDGMCRDDAILLEMWLIAKLRHEGYRLVNISEGGAGPTGIESKLKVDVYSSIHGHFKSATEAAVYMQSIGYDTARDSNIIGCCKGRHSFMYGSAWSYMPNPKHPKITDNKEIVSRNNKERCSKKIFCSNGVSFDSVVESVSWLRHNGHPKASQGSVSRACKNGGVIYSCRWSYDIFPEHDGTDGKTNRYRATRKAVCTECGLFFDSMKSAVDYLVSIGYESASYTAISKCCSNKQKSAYGFIWRLYAEDT